MIIPSASCNVYVTIAEDDYCDMLEEFYSQPLTYLECLVSTAHNVSVCCVVKREYLHLATVRTEISAVCKFSDFAVTYRYSKNLIRKNLLVCNN